MLSPWGDKQTEPVVQMGWHLWRSANARANSKTHKHITSAGLLAPRREGLEQFCAQMAPVHEHRSEFACKPVLKERGMRCCQVTTQLCCNSVPELFWHRRGITAVTSTLPAEARKTCGSSFPLQDRQGNRWVTHNIHSVALKGGKALPTALSFPCSTINIPSRALGMNRSGPSPAFADVSPKRSHC